MSEHSSIHAIRVHLFRAFAVAIINMVKTNPATSCEAMYMIEGMRGLNHPCRSKCVLLSSILCGLCVMELQMYIIYFDYRHRKR